MHSVGITVFRKIHSVAITELLKMHSLGIPNVFLKMHFVALIE